MKKNKKPSYTLDPIQVDVGRPQYETAPMQFDVSRPHVTTDPLQFLIEPPRGRGAPLAAPEGAPAKGGGRRAGGAPRQADILGSLISKAVPGAAAAGEGMVPFGEMPAALQHLAGQAWGQPIAGFDPSKLTPEELAELERMRGLGRQEVEKRIAAQPPRPVPTYMVAKR